ncbi:MAG: ACT domain-containing protein [Spirochaetota bacterium]
MSKEYAVISAIGTDRVGIVDDLSGLISEAGGNIEESKMAVLGGDFAVMMLISMEPSALAKLVAKRAEIESSLGLRLGIKPTTASSVRLDGRPYVLETVSLDGQGIVHAVSTVLRGHGINIEDLETSTEKAPLTGAPLFRMKAALVIGPEVSVAALRRELEELEAGRELDVVLAPLGFSGRYSDGSR